MLDIGHGLEMDLSAPQMVFLKGLGTKFRSFVGGFGSGKTWVGCLDLLNFAGENPGVAQGYFAPTYRDIRDTFWPTFVECAEMMGYRVVVRRADKEVQLYRGKVYYGIIICRSMEEPNSIVGFKIARALVDEIDIMAVDKATTAWRKIIARLRLNIPGVVNGIGVTTTPEGFKFVYQTFKRDRKPGYSMVQASTYENEAYLPPDYIESLKQSYPQELVDAYLMGEFVNLTSGTVLRHFDRLRNGSNETIRPKDVLHIGQDFNVNNMFSAVNVYRDATNPNGTVNKQPGWHTVEELVGLKDTPDLVETINERFKDHEIHVYPDASGRSVRSTDASKSDISLLKQAGFKVHAKKSNPPVKNRIVSLNNAYEKQLLWVNEVKCPALVAAHEQQVYAKNGEPDKEGGNDHPNDAQGYFAIWNMPVKRPRHESKGLVL